MRILIHDYCGHPFQVELSRSLAARGHQVLHLHCTSFGTPKGDLERRPDDPDGFDVRGLTLPRKINKSAFFERWRLERRYGRMLVDEVRAFAPDVVMSANTHIDPLGMMMGECRRRNIPFIFWVQDIIGEAMTRILGKRLPLVGKFIAAYYLRWEKQLLKQSQHVVGITPGFEPFFQSAGIASSACTTIPNWAPMGEVVPTEKINPWSKQHGLSDKFVFLYSGTLGFKHNPGLLLGLAEQFRDEPSVRVVVNSEGAGADWLRAQGEAKGLSGLVVNGFQPFSEMSNVLGGADVLLGILEADAGVFSVPSKVLTYHCAARPLLLAVPGENLAARIVTENRSGLVVAPDDGAGFQQQAKNLFTDRNRSADMGKRARIYAEENFDIDHITDRFEQVLASVGDGGG